MNLTKFCRSYNLSYEIVRPVISQAILERRDDCVLIIGKQKIIILDDKKFIEFINDLKRRELEQCRERIKTTAMKMRRDLEREANITSMTATLMANESAR
jgi:hypothetical protein